MKAEAVRFDEAVESVADGRPVDWDALSATSDSRSQRLAGHMRLVAAIAEVHRTAALDAVTESTAIRPQLDLAPPSDRQWGHLVLTERIGEGGFSEVYRARDPWLDRDVALKLLKPSVTGRTSGTLRIVNEARTLARVRHPNVVTVHGADVHDGRVGLWMELVRGRTLAEILTADGRFSAGEAAGIGHEVCRALAAVHAEHLVHRDVKAQNVMRDAGGRIVLMDFGAGHTPLYLAPEILAGGEATMAGDLYALGVLLFLLVSGKLPVRGATVDELLGAHERKERRRLADERSDLPEAFIKVVERALEPNPSQRFASAGEMQDALAAFIAPGDPRPVPGGPATIAARERKPAGLARTTLAAAGLLVTMVIGALWTVRTPPPPPTTEIRLVAVMPLRGVPGDADYFADGMTEALTQALARVPPLRVVSRTSVDRARTTARTLPELAQALGCDAILEGSVHKTADAIRVTVRLIHAGSDTPVWSRSFEEPLGAVFALQSRIARSVAEELAVAVTPTVQPPMIDPAAYDAYLRGRFEFRRLTQAGAEAALKHFQQALALEPRFARALVGIADCYLLLGNDFAALPQDTSARLAREAATRATELDATLADAASTLASIQFEFDWNFSSADALFQRAIALDPSLVGPREQYSSFLTSRGRFDEAFGHLAAARAVDPLSASVADRTAFAHYHARQFDRALAEITRASALDANAMSAQVGLGRVLHAMGRHHDAIAQFERASKAHANHPYFEGEIAQAEGALGLSSQALLRIRALEALANAAGSRVTPYALSLGYARIDRDVAFVWLEREFERRSPRVLWLKVDPRMDPLRPDPRFASYVRRLGLEP